MLTPRFLARALLVASLASPALVAGCGATPGSLQAPVARTGTQASGWFLGRFNDRDYRPIPASAVVATKNVVANQGKHYKADGHLVYDWANPGSNGYLLHLVDAADPETGIIIQRRKFPRSQDGGAHYAERGAISSEELDRTKKLGERVTIYFTPVWDKEDHRMDVRLDAVRRASDNFFKP